MGKIMGEVEGKEQNTEPINYKTQQKQPCLLYVIQEQIGSKCSSRIEDHLEGNGKIKSSPVNNQLLRYSSLDCPEEIIVVFNMKVFIAQMTLVEDPGFGPYLLENGNAMPVPADTEHPCK